MMKPPKTIGGIPGGNSCKLSPTLLAAPKILNPAQLPKNIKVIKLDGMANGGAVNLNGKVPVKKLFMIKNGQRVKLNLPIKTLPISSVQSR